MRATKAGGVKVAGKRVLTTQQALVAQTQDTLTDSTTGTPSTTLASISDTATKNAVASLNAQLVKIKADIGALHTILKAHGLEASA